MSRHRKRPVVIEAFRWTGGPDQTEDPVWIVDAIRAGQVYFANPGTPDVKLVIHTLEGDMRADSGDWIIRGVQGELYPCKPDIFAATYEPAEDNGVNHKLDTDGQVFFYEQDFYVLSNFSAFTLEWKGRRFDTSEAAYHWEKFPDAREVQDMIAEAPSAHVAFKIAESQKVFRRPDWDEVKLDVMRDILRAKATQHEYVRRKLIATGTRELVEDSWRDDFWGWGPNRDGQNWLGRLWMEVRNELERQG